MFKFKTIYDEIFVGRIDDDSNNSVIYIELFDDGEMVDKIEVSWTEIDSITREV